MRFWIRCVVVALLCWSGGAMAQRFGVSLQTGATPTTGFGGKLTLETEFEMGFGLTTGLRLGVLSAPVGQGLSLRLGASIAYRAVLLAEGPWWLTVYGNANLHGNFTPFLAQTLSASSTGIPENETEIEDDNKDRPGPFVPPIPTQTWSYGLSSSAGFDGAYFFDDAWSLYFGLEADATILPSLDFSLYPYLELDVLVEERFTLGLGAYLCWTPIQASKTFGYLLYGSFAYDIDMGLALRLEAGFNGAVYANLKFSWRL